MSFPTFKWLPVHLRLTFFHDREFAIQRHATLEAFWKTFMPGKEPDDTEIKKTEERAAAVLNIPPASLLVLNCEANRIDIALNTVNPIALINESGLFPDLNCRDIVDEALRSWEAICNSDIDLVINRAAIASEIFFSTGREQLYSGINQLVDGIIRPLSPNEVSDFQFRYNFYHGTSEDRMNRIVAIAPITMQEFQMEAKLPAEGGESTAKHKVLRSADGLQVKIDVNTDKHKLLGVRPIEFRKHYDDLRRQFLHFFDNGGYA